MEQNEGTIKFRQEFIRNSNLELSCFQELNNWRSILYKEGLIGQNPDKYSGFGYGNVSQRLNYEDAPINKRSFIITGSQTGHLPILTKEDYAIVMEYFHDKNLVRVVGKTNASSESLTHGGVYDLDNSIRFVFHSHSSEIWKSSKKLRIPSTKETVDYGTPEMAKEVERLYHETRIKELKIFAMGGHEDGIITFGRTSEEAGSTMLKYLNKSRKHLQK